MSLTKKAGVRSQESEWLRAAALGLALVVSAPSVNAQSDVVKSLDQIAASEMTRQKITGMSVVAVKDGRVVYAKGFGVANAESKQPVTADTVFRVGSITKMLVASAAMELAEQGRLKLDAPIGNYIVGLDPKIAALTTHQLLSHTAGLADEAPAQGPHDEGALARTAASFTAGGIFADPGRVYSYSNPGYVLVGRLLEVIKGAAFADVMRELVLRPAGLNGASFRALDVLTYPLAVGHDAKGAVARPITDHAGFWPAGFLFSSGAEFSRFLIALMNEGRIEDVQVLRPSVVAALTKANVRIPGIDGLEYGYGMVLDNTRSIKTWGHDGGMEGYASAVRMAPQFKTGVVVLMNSQAAAGGIAQRILDRLLPVSAGAVARPAVPRNVDLARFTGDYKNGSALIEVRQSGGKLTVKEGKAEAASFDAVGTDCFEAKNATACFPDGYAFLGGRAYAKQ